MSVHIKTYFCACIILKSNWPTQSDHNQVKPTNSVWAKPCQIHQLSLNTTKSNPPTQSEHNQVKSANSVWTRPQHRKSRTRPERCYNTLAYYLNIPITDVYIYALWTPYAGNVRTEILKAFNQHKEGFASECTALKEGLLLRAHAFFCLLAIVWVFQPGKCMSCGSDWVKRMSRADSFIIKPTTAPLQRKKQRETSERRDGA